MDITPLSRAAVPLSRQWRILLRKANREPVIITTRGRSSHVVMRLDHYERLTRELSATAFSTPTVEDVFSDTRPAIFNVLCRIDAYADYIAEVEAETAKEAAELAYDSHKNYRWEFRQAAEFDNRCYITPTSRAMRSGQLRSAIFSCPAP